MTTRAMDFIKIDPSEIPPSRPRGGRPLGPLSQALLAGDTVFVSGVLRGWPGNKSRVLRGYGLRVRSRRMTRDGVDGMAIWTEPLDARESRP